ncbi:unnamed protein product, partial [Amoebophrya sp. A25]
WQAYNPDDQVWIDKGEQWYAPSPFWNCMILLAMVPFYLVVAWYLAQVFSEGEGKALPMWFPCSKRYWTGKSDKKVENTVVQAPMLLGTAVPGDQIGDAVEDTVGKSREASRDGSVQCLKLSKAYHAQTALQELTLEMRRGEISTLLGHNGAGKSTLINLLTGIMSLIHSASSNMGYPPTHGHAFVNGLSIAEDMAEIQKRMGICPQDHIFFSELTGRQHIEFWSLFRGVKATDFPTSQEVDALLAAVNLSFAADRLVKQYSGGMQRKLCVAIASIGRPEVIFLDEPTTGLDPVSRRQVWDFIQRLKKDRVVVLTTHSMEEADCLSDRIGILSSGRLKTVGTSLLLKNKYGSGFRLTFNVDPPQIRDVATFVREKLPGSQILIAAGTNLSVAVPRSLAGILPNFLRQVERIMGEGADKPGGVTGTSSSGGGQSAGSSPSAVLGYGISNSTLEEVFMNLTAGERPAS